MPRNRFSRSVIKKGLDDVGKALLLPIAEAYRKTRRDTVFIGITGSCGKTTCRHLTEAILRSQFRGIASRGTSNRAAELVRSLLLTNRRHKFCLHELGAFGPDTLDELLPVFKPQVGVVLNVGLDHLSAFGSLESVAREKGKLLEILPENGRAIVNLDDPQVAEMGERTPARIISFGRDSRADFRADNPSSRWPERLSFTLCCAEGSHKVRTRLLGVHWVSSLLASIAIGSVLGVPMERALKVVEMVEPFPGRMSPVELGGGKVLIRDDWKASSWALPPMFEFLGQARAARRILVLGQVSDDRRKPKVLYRDITRRALEVAEKVCLVGRWSHHGLRARNHPGDDSVVAFGDVKQAAQHLLGYLKPGDLVYVKTSGRNDDSLASLSALLRDQGGVTGRSIGPSPATSDPEKARPGVV